MDSNAIEYLIARQISSSSRTVTLKYESPFFETWFWFDQGVHDSISMDESNTILSACILRISTWESVALTHQNIFCILRFLSMYIGIFSL